MLEKLDTSITNLDIWIADLLQNIIIPIHVLLCKCKVEGKNKMTNPSVITFLLVCVGAFSFAGIFGANSTNCFYWALGIGSIVCMCHRLFIFSYKNLPSPFHTDE